MPYSEASMQSMYWEPKIQLWDLINLGEEETKGTPAIKAAYELMKEYPGINFAGNIEGNHLFRETMTDVVVCDGFVGNVILKQGEAFHHIYKSRNLKDAYFDRLDFENYGGTPIVGINANVVIGHGISKRKAIMNMILSDKGSGACKSGSKDQRSNLIMEKIRAAITGINAWVPEYRLTNHELSKMVDTSDEWIMQRVGIKERRILKGEGLGSSDMGEQAVRGLAAENKYCS